MRTLGLCPFCNSNQLESLGDAFGRTPARTVCRSCGRTLPDLAPKLKRLDPAAADPAPECMLDIPELVIVVEMTATAKGVTKSTSFTLPYRDGEYNLCGGEYPRSRFGSITVRDDVIDFDGERLQLDPAAPVSTVRVFAAYDAARYPWREEITVSFRVDFC